MKWDKVHDIVYQNESPSLRGRGLKSDREQVTVKILRSPSLRGRGLKLVGEVSIPRPLGSPSLRGRGLKFVKEGKLNGKCQCRPLYEGVD